MTTRGWNVKFLLTLRFAIDAIFVDATHFGSIVFVGLHFGIIAVSGTIFVAIRMAVGSTIFVAIGLLFQFLEVFFKCLFDFLSDFFSLFFRRFWSFDKRIVFFVFSVGDYIIDRKV